MSNEAFIVYPLGSVADPISAFSHLFAASVFAYLGISLVKRAAGDPARSRAVIVYICSVVALLLSSGLFHLVPRESGLRDALQRLDHATIFLLIASTFTPIHTILFDGVWRWGMMTCIWILASVGIFLGLVFLNTIPESVSLVYYLAMGWLGGITTVMLWLRFGFQFISPLLYGSIAYTSGAIGDFLREPILLSGVIGPHEVFHFAVLIGIGFHWKFISSFANRAPVRNSAALIPIASPSS